MNTNTPARSRQGHPVRVARSAAVAALACTLALCALVGCGTARSAGRGTGHPAAKPVAAQAPASTGGGSASAAAARGAAQTPIHVRLSFIPGALAFAPLDVADVAGLFKKNGIDAQLVSIVGGAADAALEKGDITVDDNGFSDFLSQRARGVPVVAVQYESTEGLNLSMSSRFLQAAHLPANATLRQKVGALRGQTIAAAVPTLPPLEWLIHQYSGLVPGRDVKLVNISSTGTQIAALKSGQVAGVLSSAPTPEIMNAEGIGGIYIAYTDIPQWKSMPNGVIQVLQSTIQNHAEMVRRVVTALAEADVMLSQHPRQTAKLLAASRYFRGIAPAVLTTSVEQQSKTFENEGRMTAAGWAQAVQLQQMVKQPTPARLRQGVDWTNRFIPASG